eukprot:9485091-Pyramimonas_sp.AAC.1
MCIRDSKNNPDYEDYDYEDSLYSRSTRGDIGAYVTPNVDQLWAKPGENIPTLAASDWSAVRIYPRLMRPIGPP